MKRFALSILIAGMTLPVMAQTWQYTPQYSTPRYPVVNTYDDVTRMYPDPGTVVDTATPTVIGRVYRRGYNLRLVVDEVDVTPYSQVTQNSVTWYPQYPLKNGIHHARLTGTAYDGSPVVANWDFHTDD